jgi:ABC-2 type transport system permease protein
MRRILYLARAEVLHIVRDKATVAQALLVPIVQLLVLANAATFAIRDTPAYIVDQDRSAISSRLVGHFAASSHFRLVGEAASMEQATDAMLAGETTLTLVIPQEFERTLVRSGRARVELVVNGEKGSAAGIVLSYASAILNDYAREVSAELRPPRRGIGPETPVPGTLHIDIRHSSWYNPTLNYAHYMVPGLLVSLITIIGTLLAAQNIAREKELGTLEQLNVTPITRGQFIVGKLLPFWGLAMIDLIIGLVVGRVVFGMPMRGSLLLLFGSAAVYLVAALAIGLWISTLVETQQQAMFVSFFIMIIYLLMSGLFTPIDSMARWVQVVSMVNPVRHFVTISRAILVKGAGLGDIVQPLAILVVYAAAMIVVAVRQYSKRLA